MNEYIERVKSLRSLKPVNFENYYYHCFLNNIEYLVKTNRIKDKFSFDSLMKYSIEHKIDTAKELQEVLYLAESLLIV